MTHVLRTFISVNNSRSFLHSRFGGEASATFAANFEAAVFLIMCVVCHTASWLRVVVESLAFHPTRSAIVNPPFKSGCSGWNRTNTVPLNRRTDYSYPTEQKIGQRGRTCT